MESKFMDEMASAADFAGTGSGAGAGAGGAGAGGAGISTEMAEMASAGVRLSEVTVCGTPWFWSEGSVGGIPFTTD